MMPASVSGGLGAAGFAASLPRFAIASRGRMMGGAVARSDGALAGCSLNTFDPVASAGAVVGMACGCVDGTIAGGKDAGGAAATRTSAGRVATDAAMGA